MAKKNKKKKKVSGIVKAAAKAAKNTQEKNKKKATSTANKQKAAAAVVKASKNLSQKKTTTKPQASAWEQLNRKNNQAQQQRAQATKKKTTQQKKATPQASAWEQLNRKNNQAQQKRSNDLRKTDKDKKNKKQNVVLGSYEQLNRKNNERNQKAAQERKQAADERKKKNREEGRKAAEKGKNINALGSKVQTRTSDTTNRLQSNLEKVGTRAATLGSINEIYSSGENLREATKDKDGEYTISLEQANSIANQYNNATREQRNAFIRENFSDFSETDKKIDKKYDARISSEDLTSEDYLRLQTASRLGQDMGTKSLKGQGLDRKVGARTALTYVNSKAAMGFLEGSSASPIQLDRGSVGTYSQSERNAIENAKQSTAYKGGYIGGLVASGLATNVAGGANTALGKGLVKAVGKKGVQTTAKTAAKTTGKGTQFLADRAADAVLSAPMNISDSVKQATDTQGKIDAATALKAMGLNTLGDIVLGGGVDLLGKGVNKIVTKRNYSKIVNLMAKQKEGIPLTESEISFLNKAGKEVDANIKNRTHQTVNTSTKPPHLTSEPESGYAPNSSIKTSDGKVNTHEAKAKTSDANVRLTENDIDDYMSAGNKKAVHNKAKSEDKLVLTSDEEIKDFVNKSINENNQETKAYGVVGSRFTDDVARMSNNNVDINGKYLELPSEKIRHAKNNHANPKEIGDLPLTDADIERMPEYVDTYDEILTIKETKNGVRIVLGKKINGHAIITEMVSEGRDSVKFNNMWKVESDKYAVLKKKSRPYLGLSKEGKTHQSVESGLSTSRVKESGENVNTANAKTKADTFKVDSDETIKKRASGDWTDDEISQHATKLKKKITESLDNDGKFKLEFDDSRQRGLFGKNKLTPQKEAIAKAQAAYAKDSQRVIDNIFDVETTPSGVKVDIHEVEAQINTALEDVIDKINKGIDEEANLKLAMKLMEKATEIASSAGQALNAAKMLLKETPEGRVRLAQKEVKRLNKKFAERLDEPLELSEEQIEKIIKAADDEIDDVLGEIEIEIWDKIPATAFEKFNELRHFSMLFNAKTHLRNLVGNATFKVARQASDSIERYLTKAAKGKIEKLGGTGEMAEKVTSKEIKENQKSLDELFEKVYKDSDSKNQLIETTRPDGSKIFKSSVLNKLTNLNYKMLDFEDVKFTLRPEFRKNFVRYCKSHDLDFTNISSISKADMEKATKWAMNKAEYATFRDACALSDFLTGLKTTTAGKKGKTAVGTAGYRLANMVLESQLPFVKTPVNIFRRSIDYSPISVLRATAELATAKDAKTLINGIHHMSTGLTGTGIAALGMWLASQDMITLKTGKVSGDEYYDRDMGYQDYSLVIGGHSFTIDWLSPVQSSLFLGAEMFDQLKEGMTLDNMIKGLSALTNPLLDMSFMSSMKDTVDNFMEDVIPYGSEEKNWGGALLNLLGGSIPQGYLNSLTPQFVSQMSQALDSKQRDTRSTAEGDLAKSWDSWTKRMINKVPVLRNYVLNPKLDRFGNDKETGNNIALRVLNAFINPSNTKEINYTKTDKELIKIHNHMSDDDKNKKYFFYNFTGNPSYDLANGKRMTYDEAYKYGKANRKEQTAMIENMIGSSSYKNMTWKMKADEVNDAHWISTTVADHKTYGYKYAANSMMKNDNTRESDKTAYKMTKAAGGTDKEFIDFYVLKEKVLSRSHDTEYYTKALAVAIYEQKYPNAKTNMGSAYKIRTDKLDTAREYLKSGGSLKEYTNSMCNVMSGINRAEVSDSTKNKAVSAADFKINDRTYKAMGISSTDANMGYGLKQFGYTLKSLSQMSADVQMQFDLNYDGSLNKDEIIAYIESLGINDTTEKACVYRYFSTTKTNPYGSIPDWLGQGATDKSGSSSSSSGRSRRRSSGGSGSSSSGMSWEQWLKEMGLDTSSSSRSTRVSDNTSSSSLNDAYRKRQLKLLQATSGRRDS